jgi:hypothetical protein
MPQNHIAESHSSDTGISVNTWFDTSGKDGQLNTSRSLAGSYPSSNLQVGDVVLLQEDNLVPTKWPLGRIVNIYPGKDRIVRVVDLKTSRGIYKRPITTIALLLPVDNWTFIHCFIEDHPVLTGGMFAHCCITSLTHHAFQFTVRKFRERTRDFQ